MPAVGLNPQGFGRRLALGHVLRTKVRDAFWLAMQRT